MINAF